DAQRAHGQRRCRRRMTARAEAALDALGSSGDPTDDSVDCGAAYGPGGGGGCVGRTIDRFPRIADSPSAATRLKLPGSTRSFVANRVRTWIPAERDVNSSNENWSCI